MSYLPINTSELYCIDRVGYKNSTDIAIGTSIRG